MRYFLTCLLGLSILISPIVSPTKAQATEPAGEIHDSEMQNGMSLMEEGMRLLFEGLIDEMEPTLEDLRDMAKEMEPAMQDLRDMIGDMGQYQKPEVLPNGDIIIRRKTPLAPKEPETDEIDL